MFLHKIFVKTYNWSALGVFVVVVFFVFFGGGVGVQHMLPVTVMQRKKYMKSEIACYFYIYSSLQAAPLISSLPPQGRSERLLTFNVSFSRGYYVNVPYISKSNTVFNLLYLFSWCLSLHPIRDKDTDKWLNTCSYWVIWIVEALMLIMAYAFPYQVSTQQAELTQNKFGFISGKELTRGLETIHHIGVNWNANECCN